MPTVTKESLGVTAIQEFDGPRRFSLAGEHAVLVALMRNVKARRVLEIGVNEGRTAKTILQNLPGIEEYIGVDVTPDYVPQARVQAREVPRTPGRFAKSDPRFRMVIRPRGSFDIDRKELGAFDAIFIDGDHGWKGVLHDTLLALELVKPTGVVIWHDYHDRPVVDVRGVLERFHANGWPVQHVEKTWIAFMELV